MKFNALVSFLAVAFAQILNNLVSNPGALQNALSRQGDTLNSSLQGTPSDQSLPPGFGSHAVLSRNEMVAQLEQLSRFAAQQQPHTAEQLRTDGQRRALALSGSSLSFPLGLDFGMTVPGNPRFGAPLMNNASVQPSRPMPVPEATLQAQQRQQQVRESRIRHKIDDNISHPLNVFSLSRPADCNSSS